MNPTEFHFKNNSLVPEQLRETVLLEGEKLTVIREAKFKQMIPHLIYRCVFGQAEEKLNLSRIIHLSAESLGIYKSSLYEYYRSTLENPAHFCVPAVNLRAIPFVSACGIFEAANELEVQALIFELSRGESVFTGQSPSEYATVILAAAIYTGYRGPIFLQGDHFQISKKRFEKNPEQEINDLKQLILEAVRSGFHHLDIDCSTLVDLTHKNPEDQQRRNATYTHQFIQYCLECSPYSPSGLTLGAEVGEIGEGNTTTEEIDAFFNAYGASLKKEVGENIDGNFKGTVKNTTSPEMPDHQIIKMAVQTGTKHGGNVGKDGQLLDMDIDYQRMEQLSTHLRKHYRVAGISQHGASTLSLEKLSKLKNHGSIEVHLAATFLNIVYDHLPRAFRSEAHGLVRSEFISEKKGLSDEQFLYQARRLVVGKLKERWWNLPQTVNQKIQITMKRRAEEIFRALGVVGSAELISKLAPRHLNHRSCLDFGFNSHPAPNLAEISFDHFTE